MDIVTLKEKEKAGERVVLALEPTEAVKLANILDFACYNNPKISDDSRRFVKDVVRSAAKLEKAIKSGWL